MTGKEHYREAERLAKLAADFQGDPRTAHIQLGQLAQVHATLALAAATEDYDWDHAVEAARS